MSTSLKSPKRKLGNIFSPNPDAAAPEPADHVLKRSYSDHNILYGPSSSGMLLERWGMDRDKINLLVNPEEILDIFREVLPADRECRGYLGTGGMPHVMRRSCVGCQLLGRLLDRGKKVKNKTITIRGGSAAGRRLHVSHKPYSLDSLVNYKECLYPRQNGLRILEPLRNILSCEKGYMSRISRTRTFATTSAISNYITVSCVLEREMKLLDLPGLPIFRWAYQCGDGVIMVEENLIPKGSDDFFFDMDYMKPILPPEDATHLDPDVTRLVLMQVAMNLLFLNNYDFTHGDPSLEHVIITREPCSMKYDSIRIESPFTVHIIPAYCSSVTLNVDDDLVRIYCMGAVEPMEPEIKEISKIRIGVDLASDEESQSPCIPTHSAKESVCARYEKMKIVSYKIGATTAFDKYVKHMGIALFPSSFDTYAFFVALMTEESFYQSLIKHVELYRIWQRMWRNEEFPAMMEQLSILRNRRRDSGNRLNYRVIRHFLSQFHLRCDGLGFLWNSLKNLGPI